MSNPTWRQAIAAAVPTRTTDPLPRSAWSPEGKPTEAQRKEWRDRAARMIREADGIPAARKARMIIVAKQLATRCDLRGEVLMNLATMVRHIEEVAGTTSEQTVRRAIRDLDEFGYVEVEPRARSYGAQTGNLYRLLPLLDVSLWGESETKPCHADTPPPYHGDTPTLTRCHPTRPYHPDTPNSSSLSRKASSKGATSSATPVAAAADSLASTNATTATPVAVTVTSPAEASGALTPTAHMVEAIRSVGLEPADTWASRVAHHADTEVLAKVEQAKAKDNPAGWLRGALTGMANEQARAVAAPKAAAPVKVSKAVTDARSAVASLYVQSVPRGSTCTRSEALALMHEMEQERFVLDALSDEARVHVDAEMDAILAKNGHHA